MKIILNEYVQFLGEAGDTVDVKPGYARNYLLPKKLGFEATPQNIKTYENNLRQRARKIAKIIKAAEEQKARLEAAGDLVFTRKSGDDGKLFGSVTGADIHKALEEKGFDIDKRKIGLEHPVKQLGATEVAIKVHSKIEARVNVVVKPEVEEEPATDPNADAPTERDNQSGPATEEETTTVDASDQPEG